MKWEPIRKTIFIELVVVVIIMFLQIYLEEGFSYRFKVELQTTMLISGMVGLLLGIAKYSVIYNKKKQKEQEEQERWEHEQEKQALAR